MADKIRDAKPGQRVGMVEDFELVFGNVVKQLPDRVVIKWDDIDSECQHFEDEWHDIACVE